MMNHISQVVLFLSVVINLSFCPNVIAQDSPFYFGQVQSPEGKNRTTYFSQSGNFIITKVTDPFAGKIYSIPDLKLVFEASESRDNAIDFVLVDETSTVILLTAGEQIRLFDLGQNIPKKIIDASSKFYELRKLYVSADMKYFGCGDKPFQRGTTWYKSWRLDNYKSIKRKITDLSNTGRYAYSSYVKKMYEMPRGKKIKDATALKADNVTFTSDDRYVAASSPRDKIQLFDLHNLHLGNLLNELDESIISRKGVSFFSPNDKYFVIVDNFIGRRSDGDFQESGKVLLLPLKDDRSLSQLVFTVVPNRVRGSRKPHFSFSTNDKYMLAGSDVGEVVFNLDPYILRTLVIPD